jgi:hypothetical protein
VRTDRCGNTSVQKCHTKGNRKGNNRDATNVGHEMYDYTVNMRGHRNSNETFTEEFGTHVRRAVSRFTKTDRHAWNITSNTKKYCSLKLEA